MEPPIETRGILLPDVSMEPSSEFGGGSVPIYQEGSINGDMPDFAQSFL